MINLEETAHGVIVPVRVKASARRNAVAGEHDGALRIDVTTAPEKGKANHAVIDVLAEAIGVSKSSIELIGGATSPQKRFVVAGMSINDLERRLRQALMQIG
jgi:uncharacterized protein (TIGR00251 family)